jgi:predicted ATP-grasp superfamily ATP-dependent carboligase
MPHRRIAIVGASVRAAAASAVRAGFQVTAADLFADDDLRTVAQATKIGQYPGELLSWLRALEPKPAAWMYTGALENHPELVDAMAAVAPLLGNRGEVLQQVRSPWRLAEVLMEAGLLFPETRVSPDGLPCDGSWLTKTGRGASGSGVRALTKTRRQGDKETRRQETTLSPSRAPYLVYQRRVAGTPCSAVFVADGGTATLLGVVRQLVGEDWLGAGEFQYCGAIGPYPLAAETLSRIAGIGNVLAERLDLAGLFGVDLIIDGGQVWTIEVNPRYTASTEIVERATGIGAIAAHAAACRRHRWSSAISHRVKVIYGKAILFAKRPVAISSAFADWARNETLRNARWPSIADVSPLGTEIDTGRPVITLFADGTTVDQVTANLKLRVAIIQERLYVD